MLANHDEGLHDPSGPAPPGGPEQPGQEGTAPLEVLPAVALPHT